MRHHQLGCLLLAFAASCSSAPRVTTADERIAAMALLATAEQVVGETIAKLRIAVNESATKPVKWADIYGRILTLVAALR